MRKKLIVLLSALALVGCVSERGANEETEPGEPKSLNFYSFETGTVELHDGSKVLCIARGTRGGLSCDWIGYHETETAR